MKTTHRHHPQPRKMLMLCILSSALLGAGISHAQLASATLRGTISAGGTKAPAGTEVLAVNKATGNTFRTQTLGDGSYVLVGLKPGQYEVRVAGASKGQLIELNVGETAHVDLASAGNQLDTVVIQGSAQRQDVRDSQVGTTVSNKLIEALPQYTRNFLSSADLAPGVRFDTDSTGNTKLRSGAQNRDAVNVFIDGMGQKNNILRGGLTGQDTSQGNPFPQSAIAEYKVLTQNYKAEFDQVSAAAITAVTKSGGNQLAGDVYASRTGDNWRAYSPLERQREAAGTKRPKFDQIEAGFSLGGAFKQDVAHYFLAYDGKTIERPVQVNARHLDKYPGNPGIVPQLAALAGPFTTEFKEHLLFGKVNAVINDEQRIEGSFKIRRETSYLLNNEGTSAASTAINQNNDETRLDIKHEWGRGPWLNELRAGYEHGQWNPQSDANTPLIRYKYSPTNLLSNVQDIIAAGGSPNAQDRQQKGVYLKNDLSYTGLQGHVMKGGVQLKAMAYELSGTSRRVNAVNVVLSTLDGQPFYANGLCTGSNVRNNGLESDQCRIEAALAPAAANLRNKQFGLYFQDDWALTRQLELNLGLRWDYENNMLNNGYVTPADRVTALKGLDGRTINGPSGPIVAPADQTYAQSLAKGGININDYISNGSSRKAFKGAFAPRLGFSYDLKGDKQSVIYGGWGRSYDRAMANHSLDELQKNAQAGGEIWLIKNDFKMPFADQISLGLRQALGSWNMDITLSQVAGKNQFIWFGGNRDPNGGWGNQSSIDPLWNGPRGYGTLVLGDFVGENRTRSLFLKLEKPYTKASGWTVSAAYTHSKAETTNKDWSDDIFDWTYGRDVGRGWKPNKDSEDDRLVLAGMIDTLPWGLMVSGKYTLGSGKPRVLTDCSKGFSQCVYQREDADFFRQFDLGVAKGFKIGSGDLRVRLDVLNLFNTVNWGFYNDWVGGPSTPPRNAYGGDNPNLGQRNGLAGDMRTVRLTASYSF